VLCIARHVLTLKRIWKPVLRIYLALFRKKQTPASSEFPDSLPNRPSKYIVPRFSLAVYLKSLSRLRIENYYCGATTSVGKIKNSVISNFGSIIIHPRLVVKRNELKLNLGI